MSSQQTGAVTALRALCAAVDEYLPQWGEPDKRPLYRALYDAEVELKAIDAAIPPEDAPAVDGGDAVRDLDLIWHSVSDDKETNAAYERLRTRLAAAPAPAVEWEAVFADLLDAAKELRDLMQGVIDGDYKPDSFTLQSIDHAIAEAESTPPAEAREPLGDDLLRWVKAQADDEHANPRFRELYAALAQPQATPREHPAAQGDAEAVREDAERWRKLEALVEPQHESYWYVYPGAGRDRLKSAFALRLAIDATHPQGEHRDSQA